MPSKDGPGMSLSPWLEYGYMGSPGTERAIMNEELSSERELDRGAGGSLRRYLSRLLSLQDLGVDTAPRLQTLKVEEPPKRKGGVMVQSVAELVDRLRHEAKVL